jgi:hypothetical protein
MYDIAPTPVTITQPQGVYQIDAKSAAEIHIARLEQEIYALQSGREFT